MADAARDLTCPQCSTVNRVYPERLKGAATCTSCGQTIPRETWDVHGGVHMTAYVTPKGLPVVVALKCPKCSARRIAYPSKIAGRPYCVGCGAPLDYATDAEDLTDEERATIAAEKRASDRNMLILVVLLAATFGPLFLWNVWNDARMKQFNPRSPSSPPATVTNEPDGVIPPSAYSKIAEEIGDKPDASAWDGRIACAQEALEKSVNDPSSLSVERWWPVIAMRFQGQPYWLTRVSFRAKNGFGALVKREMFFYIQHDHVVIAKESE